ncbi:MAG: formylglycine-generating enzyme family protein [Opitutaceae bacterium]|jgi:formylglycine-generating enzyme required for sulfatase activity|nr:formylglycine-generating enzyme family protein [Opitutaceae bacterium]
MHKHKQKQKSTGVAALLTALAMTGVTAFGITIDTVTIGGAGNDPDDRKMLWDGGTSGYGSVPYTYEIGKTEVTCGQYAEFLNAVAKTSDTYRLYSELMDKSKDPNGCGITRSGTDGDWSYEATDPLKPVNYVSVYDAMRFTNWLTNGATTDVSSTETGVYTLSGDTAIPSNPTVGRNLLENGTVLTGTGDLANTTGTVWALASENEWYKAAYYNVSSSQYSLYANGQDSITGAEANYEDTVNNYTDYELKDASSYADEQNGTKDMMGNVQEWNDSLLTTWGGQDLKFFYVRGARGGTFYYSDAYLASSGRYNYGGSEDGYDLGFRVVSLSILAAVPEPEVYAATIGLMMLIIGLWIRRGRSTL